MFNSKIKNPPKITADNIELEYDQKNNQWLVNYNNIEFIFNGNEIIMPKEEVLSKYLSWVELHKDHIDENAKEMANDLNDIFLDTTKAHIASIEIEASNKIAVMILGDKTWGDMGYDIWLENGEIVNEGFAD